MSRRVACWTLVALVLVAFVERWAGLGAELPQREEPDTAFVHRAALRGLPAHLAPHEAAFEATMYPFLLSDPLLVLPGAKYAEPPTEPAVLEQHLVAAAGPHLRARRFLVLLSLLFIPVTYRLARLWLARGSALLAAAFAATSLLHLGLSEQAKPHAASSSLAALALLASIRVACAASRGACADGVRAARSTVWKVLRVYAFAGLAAGLAFGALQSGAIAIIALAMAHCVGVRVDPSPARTRGAVVAAVLVALLAAWSYRYAILGDPLEVDVAGALDFGQQSFTWSDWNCRGFLDIVPALAAFDPVLVALALAGLASAVFARTRPATTTADPKAASKSRSRVLVATTFALLYLAAFGSYRAVEARHLLPIAPLACVLAAFAVAQCAARAFRPAPAVSCACAAFALALPAYVSARYAWIRTRPDTQTLAARWVEQHVRSDEKVALDLSLALPLVHSSASLAAWPRWRWSPWLRYQAELLGSRGHLRTFEIVPIFQRGWLENARIDTEEARAYLLASNADWIVTCASPEFDGGRNDTWRAARAVGTPLAALVSPFTDKTIDSTERGFGWSALDVLRTDRPGPAIEIRRGR